MAINKSVNKREDSINTALQAWLDDIAQAKQRGKPCYTWFSFNKTPQDPPVWMVGHQSKVLDISILIAECTRSWILHKFNMHSLAS
jgi:hypothetical protein